MRLSAPVFAVLTSAVIAVTAMGSQNAAAVAPLAIQAQALETRPQSRMEGDEAMDNAVAAAVIGAVAKQFGEQQVAVKLDQVAVKPASPRDRSVNGEGRLQLGGEAEWIPFEFSVMYDTVATEVTYPQLKIGGQVAGNAIAADSKVALALTARVDAALRSEFDGQQVGITFDRVATKTIGKRFLHVTGSGSADFGAEGATPAHVEAVYDHSNDKWMHVAYELGTTSNWADNGAQPIAMR